MNKPRFRAEQLLQDASSACSNYDGSLDKIKGLVDPLPLLIRRHGLAVTLHYLRHRKCEPEAQDGEEAEWVICQAFSLDRWLADGIPGSGPDQKIDYICKCPTREYGVLSERMYALFEALRTAVQAHQAVT
ncbi:MAG: type III-B CRISPR module-associated protein Cmr5, partial [Gammaproteobacteria bacterium]